MGNGELTCMTDRNRRQFDPHRLIVSAWNKTQLLVPFSESLCCGKDRMTNVLFASISGV